MFGARLTLNIDCSLSPNQVMVPSYIFNHINLLTKYCIVKRDPSISNKCLYVCEVLQYESEGSTIRVNPFIVDGMHADQDGDELSVLFLQRESDVPTPYLQAAIMELQKQSWEYGKRVDIFNKPKYNFGQHYKYLIYCHNEYFMKNNAFWAKLSGSVSKKLDKIMSMGTMYRKECDEFISQVIAFNNNTKPILMRSMDLLTESKVLANVYLSESKGSETHMKEYLKRLLDNEVTTDTDAIDKFNSNVSSSRQLELEGQNTFNLLFATNSVNLMNSDVYYSNNIIISSYYDCGFVKNITMPTTGICTFIESFLSE